MSTNGAQGTNHICQSRSLQDSPSTCSGGAMAVFLQKRVFVDSHVHSRVSRWVNPYHVTMECESAKSRKACSGTPYCLVVCNSTDGNHSPLLCVHVFYSILLYTRLYSALLYPAALLGHATCTVDDQAPSTRTTIPTPCLVRVVVLHSIRVQRS